MDIALQQELILMADTDQRVLSELFGSGELPAAEYHPKMRALHEENAARLKEIIAEYGWPDNKLVGVDGAEAAWLIAQHAVSDLDFMRKCSALVQQAVAAKTAEGWQLAFLQDRVLTLSGKAQFYGTQFDVDAEGMPVSFPIAEMDTVNQRRAALGLNTLEERLQELRERERQAREVRQ